MLDSVSCFLYIASHDALVAQLDRATGYEPVGQEFESLRAHHANSGDQFYWSPFLLCTVAFRKACISVSVLHPAAYCKAAPGSSAGSLFRPQALCYKADVGPGLRSQTGPTIRPSPP